MEADAGGLAVRHHYNSFGFEEKLSEAYTGEIFWKAHEFDASGRLVREELGNGVETTRSHNQLNGTLTRTQSRKGAGSHLHDMEFDWDSVGNLQWRKDYVLGLTENFAYDSLNHLTSSQVTGQSANLFTYDSAGNILSKTGIGTYHYADSTRPHRLTSITQSGNPVRNYSYDANGAILSDGKRSYTWTSFNKVASISQSSAPGVYSYAGASLWAAGSSLSTFEYDSSNNRVRQVLTRAGNGINSTTSQRITTYVGSYEREEHYNSSNVLWQIRHRHSVGGFLQIKRTETSGQSGITEEKSYFLKDHLGSVTAVLDASGSVVERPSFDAWGKTRDADTWADVDANSQWLSSNYTNRGYTGHEQLDEVGLVHMNGRIYDPEAGRFLSPDPYIQDPEHSQNFNRYTYVLNNPLSYTDPSGHFFVALFAAAVKFTVAAVVAVVKAAVAIGKFIHIGVKAFLKTGLGKFLFGKPAGFLSSISKGATWGGINSAISGGNFKDILRGALIGGITAGLTFGVVNKIDNFFLRAAGHGVVGGATNEVMGGKFEDGFISAAGSQVLAPLGGNQNTLSGMIRQSVIGGTLSVIGGGKFANGAYTAAFHYLMGAGADSEGEDIKEIVRSAVQLPFKIIGHLNVLGNMADYMRTKMIAQSRLDDGGPNRSSRNIGYPSVGFRAGGVYRLLMGMGYGGDGIKIGGGRVNEYSDKPSPLGGIQGREGRFLGKVYAPFDARDFLVEVFSGPHDYLNSPFWYDSATGNIRSGMSRASRTLGGVMNVANLAVALPFVASSVVLPTSSTFK